MPRKPNSGFPVPKLHKASGQARLRWRGHDYYFGQYGTVEAAERYARWLAEHQPAKDANCRLAAPLSAVLAGWWERCKQKYGTSGRGPNGNADNWRPIIKWLRQTYGETPVNNIDATVLGESLCERAAGADWSHSYLLMQLSRIRRIWRYGYNKKLVSSEALTAIQNLDLEFEARSTEKIPLIPDDTIQQTLARLPANVADMVMLQRLTGARPDEICRLRPCDINRDGETWIYVLDQHKTSHHGKDRTIFIGPRAQKILAPWLLRCASDDDFVFPTNRSPRFTTDSYRAAIWRACDRAGIERWSPNRLRKTAAQAARDQLDIESAGAMLGHSSSAITGEHYAELSRARALAAAQKLG